MIPQSCPFSAKNFEHIRQALLDLSLQDLIFQTELVMDELTPVEKLNYNINHFCNDFSDKNGRIEFIRAVMEAGIVGALQIPFFYQSDPRMEKLLRKKQHDYYMPPLPAEAQTEEAALTDDLEETTGEVQVTNPRWEHEDTEKAQNSPETAFVGDGIMLLADVQGIPEGAQVTFDIFDTTEEPPLRIDTAKGKNEGGTARASWVVQDPNERGEALSLQFEGIAKSKASSRAEIQARIMPVLWFHIDLDNPLSDDDKIILRTTDGSSEYVIHMKDMKEAKEDMVLLTFPTMEDGQRYDLIYDPGVDGEPVIFEHDVDKAYLLGVECSNSDA